jgi:hypothetical protein
MKIFRRIILYIFVLFYCCACPLLVLYSFGYIFNPTDNQISHTGLIFIHSVPSAAHIYLERSHYLKKTPATLEELIPGDYNLTLRSKGYRSWKHLVRVEEGKASAFENVLLVRDILSPTLLSGTSYVRLYPDIGKKTILLDADHRFGGMLLFDTREFTADSLIPSISEFAAMATRTILTEGKSPIVVFFGGKMWDKRYYVKDLSKPASEMIDITNFVEGKIEYLTWAPHNNRYIFAVYADRVKGLDLTTMATFVQYEGLVKGFGISSKDVYVLDGENVLMKYPIAGDKSEELLNDRYLANSLFVDTRTYRIGVLDERTLVFLGDDGRLIVTVPPYLVREKDVMGYRYLKEKKKLLLWTANEVWIADLAEEDQDKAIFGGRLRVRCVYDGGANIRQALWCAGDANILIQDKNSVFLLGLMPDDNHHLEPLIKVKSGSDIYYSETDGHLYYLDKDKGHFMSLEIVPEGSGGVPSAVTGKKE